MGLIGPLVASLLVAQFSLATQSKREAAKTSASKLSRSLDMYFIDCNEFPEKLQHLLKKPPS
ncbi:MAG: type II secretion system protein GspG [Bdellovibrionales bacterium]